VVVDSRKVGAQARQHLRADLSCARVPRSLWQLVLAAAMLLTSRNAATAQLVPLPDSTPSLPADVPAEAPQPIPAGPMVAVHGVVRNAATGEPLPRALVQVGGETGPGALTDGDGKFDLSVPGPGPHVFQLTRPGFHDLPPVTAAAGTLLENANSITHNVYVIDDMPGLSFAMTPTGAIRGHIDLSTGDPAQGIGVILSRRIIQGGHAIWRASANTRTNSDGAYRFAALDDGDYAIATESARDSDIAGNLVEQNSEAKVKWSGYAATYYPDAREFSAAARIHVSGGETAQANFALKLEPFHLVRAVVAQAKDSDKSVVDYGASLLDAQGHSLSYPAQYDADSRTVQAMLPDGSYSLQVTAVKRPNMGIMNIRNSMTPIPVILQGTTDFTVAGHPITSLRIALAQKVANPLAVNVIHGSGSTAPNLSQKAGVFVSVSQAGDSLVDGMWTQFAQGPVPGQLETSVLPPGSYWVHTSIGQSGLCESSFTAGGASLAREPLVIGPGGASAPLALTLREDCATLNLSLPANLLSQAAGEEPAFTVYVVPDFDSTVDVVPLTLRASAGGTLTLDNLTPGTYRVYTFSAPVELEYHNPDSLSALANRAQAVTLQPSSPSTLALEVPAP
jgi:hypothetical protein